MVFSVMNMLQTAESVQTAKCKLATAMAKGFEINLLQNSLCGDRLFARGTYVFAY